MQPTNTETLSWALSTRPNPGNTTNPVWYDFECCFLKKHDRVVAETLLWCEEHWMMDLWYYDAERRASKPLRWEEGTDQFTEAPRYLADHSMIRLSTRDAEDAALFKLTWSVSC